MDAKVILLISACLITVVRAEMFTALAHMRGLAHLEGELFEGLKSYIAAEETRLQQLKKFASEVELAQTGVQASSVEQHLNDPINSVLLITRFYNGWKKLNEIVYQDNSIDLMANISLNDYQMPKEEDYKGSFTALRRLQDTYRLKPVEINSGQLGGLNMTARDCYNAGRENFLANEWKHTRQWMQESLKKSIEDEEQAKDVDIVDIYDHLSYSEYKLGNIKKAIQYSRDLLQNEPDHKRTLDNLGYFQAELNKNPDQYEKYVDDDYREDTTEEHDRYTELCRRPDFVPPELHRKYICFYYTNHRNPRLLLQPAKVEIANLKPRVWMLRSILTETEMNRLKEIAGPKLNRATARNHRTGRFEPADYRISKSAWLGASDDPLGYVKKIDQRIEDITSLDMSTAEQLQVCNYGIGGHYEPHFDFARKEEDAFTSLGTGNRIATVLFYMSDVSQGGATVFPNVGARIPPGNGDAAFWWNLKRSGEGDYSTRHAACPVLVGTKWVCNKWIHERGQEFRRPCGLSPSQ
ncbi:prolyl 4-hydroxylase subunit alpha-1-like isoform X1 [Dysidea avara]|uniref:prolyl 4-hydroxylase subunit alpha-1-like isoform X1 n=1 Tax=Dysidea avara TaxID=196820 RepID=UPI00332B74A8